MHSTQRVQNINSDTSQTVLECIGCGAKYSISVGVVDGNCEFCATPFAISIQPTPTTVMAFTQSKDVTITAKPVYKDEITVQKGSYAMRPDEVVILRSETARHVIPKLETRELILTNFSVVANNYKSKGLTGSRVYTSYCYPLNLIEVQDGQVQMSFGKTEDEYNYRVVLHFIKNKEKVTFEFDDIEELKQWVSCIYEQLTGSKLNIDEIKEKKQSGRGSGVAGFITDVVGESILERLFGI